MSQATLAKRWTFRETPNFEEYFQLRDSLNLNDTLASTLWHRGVRDFEAARRFFRPTDSNLHDPFKMKDMDKAVDRVIRAVNGAENILVYGDYDVDGTTAVALVSSYLEQLTDKVATYIPDRYKEGYGLSRAGIEFAADNGFSLIIALDCGIKAFEQADFAKEQGIDLIICDHHTPGDHLPDAFAILDPKRKDCTYPFKELSGCGVGYKLCLAIQRQKGWDEQELDPLLDLLAVSIGADIVPIVDENRILAIKGLEVINTRPRPAFDLIIKQAGKSKFSIMDVVFTIAPRINAAGRIKHGSEAVELLKCNNNMQAQSVLAEINEHNKTRKDLDKSITEEALRQVENEEELQHSSVVFHSDWHKGVIGIVASRLIETYYRPTIVLTESNGHLAGSARSVIGFNLYDALDACSEHLIQFGGHKYAAGMTLEESKWRDFARAFDAYVGENLTEEMKVPEILVDADLNISDITKRFYNNLIQFEPHGPDNDKPVFRVAIDSPSNIKKIGQDKNHLKFEMGGIDCIGFGLAEWHDALASESLEMLVHLEMNEFRGAQSLQLRILDIRRVGDV